MTAPEQLPEYHDEPRVDPVALLHWVRQHCRDLEGFTPGPGFLTELGKLRHDREQAAERVTPVIQALQATGDATLVKNATYRSMLRDRADLERLAAHLLNGPHAAAVLEADGDPVTAAIRLISNGTA
jgi:hypothetical protein